MAARKATFGWPKVGSQFTLSGGSWQASYPLASLQSLPISDIARSADLNTANTVIIGTSSVTRRVGLVALARHNFTLDAQIRIRLYSDAAMTALIYDSGFADVWGQVYPWDQPEWEDDTFWTSKYLASELAGTTWLWIWLAAAGDYMAAAFRIDISDPGNAAGYVQAGYLDIAAQYQCKYNFTWGSQYGFRSPARSLVTEAQGGAKYIDDRDEPRVFKGTILAPRSEALAKHFEIRRQLKSSGAIVWIPEPDTPSQWPRTAMLAQLVDPGLMAYRSAGLDDVPIALEEVIG